MSEVPLMPLWSTVAVTIWALIGPLVGILVGHYLSKSWQREQWVADNRKVEYRELLKALTFAATVLMGYKGAPGAKNPEEQRRSVEAHNDALRCIADRMFIAEEIHKICLYDKWTAALLELQNTSDIHKFSDRFEEIRNNILSSALKTNSISYLSSRLE